MSFLRAAVAVLAGLLLAQPQLGLAQTTVSGEAALKTRLALSLVRFTQWPASPPVGAAGADTLRLCVALRDADMARAFAEVDGKLVNGHLVQVQKLPTTLACHVLYVHASAERVGDLLRAANGQATLTIGDGEGFLGLGGMVELVTVNDALRFDVSLGALRSAQLVMSSQALKLARQVRE